MLLPQATELTIQENAFRAIPLPATDGLGATQLDALVPRRFRQGVDANLSPSPRVAALV
jgi:hypothetical protein